jgi:tRNA A37 threonylcarbamoyltransferase TsaD
VACHIPPLEYTTDNAAMIAATGYFRARAKDFTPWQKLKADSNLEFK